MTVVRALLVLACFAVGCIPRGIGASLIEHPLRTPELQNPPPHEDISFRTTDGLLLKGWLFRTSITPAKGWVVYLHGRDANRSNGALAAKFLLPRGYNVLAYDHRAHGQSDGTFCTYGVKEQADARQAIETFTTGQVFLIGESLGAATALMASANNPRVKGVVAAAPYSDMKSIIEDTARTTNSDAAAVLRTFEKDTGIKVSDASPMDAAKDIHVPVLFIHGDEDTFMKLEHIERIRRNLSGPSRLVRLTGVSHGDVLLHDEVWSVIADWIDQPSGSTP